MDETNGKVNRTRRLVCIGLQGSVIVIMRRGCVEHESGMFLHRAEMTGASAFIRFITGTNMKTLQVKTRLRSV